MSDDSVPPAQKCTLPSCTNPAVDPLSNGALCQEHLDGLDEDGADVGDQDHEGAEAALENDIVDDVQEDVEREPLAGDKPDVDLETTDERDHENPIDVSDVTDAGRAEMLREYLEAFVDEFGKVPRLMPLKEDGKAPAAGVTYAAGRAELVDGRKAIRQIREQGARGFALYAGRWDCNTEDLVLVDVDDRETFPYEAFPDTLEVLSGSGRGEHFTFRNAGDVENAKGKDGVDGEIRSKNWYCVTPGSVHPTGGVYHVQEERDVATLEHDDVPEELQPGTSSMDRDEIVELDPPEALESAEFTNDFGTSLEELRERDEKLDALLERLQPPGFAYPSTSEADFATVTKLWFWRFSEQQIADIMRKYRRRGKIIDRDGYLATTISKAARGERFDPDGDDDDGDARPVSALPLAQLDALSPQQRRRAAKKRDLEWPSTQEARDRLFEVLTEVMANEDDRVIDAPTSLGKSYTVASTHWNDPQYDAVTGGRPVVHLSKTRDARDEAIATANENDVDNFVLRARHEACPVAAGDYDPPEDDDADEIDDTPITLEGVSASEWLREQCEGKGIPFSAAHRHLEQHNDQGISKLPCCGDHQAEGEDQADSSECPAIKQWKELREAEDLALIQATHEFAHVPGLRMHTNIVFDEEPDFEQDLDQNCIRRAVSAYLREVGADLSTFEQLLRVSKEGLSRNEHDPRSFDQRWEDLRADLNVEPDREWYFENPNAHTLAPALARAILNAEDRGNGRRAATVPHEPPRLDANAREEDGWNREWVTVVLDDENTIRTVRTAPDLGIVRSVIGLDAHPSIPVWARNTVQHIDGKDVLEPEERRLWRRYERGLRVVQVGDATRPLASGKYFNEEKTSAIVEQLREEYGADFCTAITASSVEHRLADIMKEAGVSLTPADDGGYEELMHFGEEKSRNDFAAEEIGFVNGCIDPGDDFVLDLIAELDLDAEPERSDVECSDCGGDGCYECDDTGRHRAHGRGFVGEDAATAEEILASVRENHTAQSAGRYARNPSDPESTATVFVRTDALPLDFADVQVPGVEWLFGDVQQAIVEQLRSIPGMKTARELADAVGCSKEHVRSTLKRLVDRDAVQAVDASGPHGATLFGDAGVAPSGVVEVTPDEIANGPVWGSYTWALAIRDPTERDIGPTGGGIGSSPRSGQVWNWRDVTDPGE